MPETAAASTRPKTPLPDTAGEIAAATPLRLATTTTVGEALDGFRQMSTGRAVPLALVEDADGRPAGLVALADCVLTPRDAPALGIAAVEVPTATRDEGAEAAAYRLLRTAAPALVVTAADGSATGLITREAAQAHLLGELQEDSDRFVGLTSSEPDAYVGLGAFADFRRRIPWVFGLAVAGLAAGYVVHVYEDALDALVILALYMPMVADTGGNVGTQSASLITRAIATGHLKLASIGTVLWRESRVAVMIAAVLFAFAFLKVLLISNAGDVPTGLTLEAIGFAIALALAVQVVTATLIGALLPFGALVIRQDPAVVSGPALTTIVDLSGLIIYFSLTTWLLGINISHG